MKRIDLRDFIKEKEKRIIVANILSKLDDFYRSTFCEGIEFHDYIKELSNLYDEWLADVEDNPNGVFENISCDGSIWFCIGKFLFFSINVEGDAKESIRARIYRDEIFVQVGCILKVVAGFTGSRCGIDAIEDVFNFDKGESWK